jgi:Flp pilus assembly pilin Flp
MDHSARDGYLALVAALVRREDGQDLIEYAYLACFIGIAGYLVLGSIGPAVSATYTSWLDPTSGAPSLWDPPAPAGR